MGVGDGGSCGISAGASFGAVPLFPGCAVTLKKLLSPASCSSCISFNGDSYLNVRIVSVSSAAASMTQSAAELPGIGTSYGKIMLCQLFVLHQFLTQ